MAMAYKRYLQQTTGQMGAGEFSCMNLRKRKIGEVELIGRSMYSPAVINQKKHWFPSPGQGAPGIAFPVKLPGNLTKPVIVLSTDDGGQVLQLTPVSNEPTHWDYAVGNITESAKGTIGTPSAVDVDGDGWPELFVPKNAEGVLEMWTWAHMVGNNASAFVV